MITPKIQKFLEENPDLPTPFLVVDKDIIATKYDDLHSYFDFAQIFYAVKSNPAKDVIEILKKRGSSFDVASIYEIDWCFSLGVSADKLSYGNTIKKEEDIKYAYDKGVRIYAFDSLEEIQKISRAAPGSKVFCRILVENKYALWPLSKKFGCNYNMAIDLLAEAKRLGLEPWGISFHVGSQQLVAKAWKQAFIRARFVFDELEKKGIKLTMLNLGGGFPAFGYYNTKTPKLEEYCNKITHYLHRYFEGDNLTVLIEPGRYIGADAGVTKAEVVLVSTKEKGNKKRWVYLDAGLFRGLIETLGESIHYKIITEHKEYEEKGPVYLAGPTCDSMDIMYQKTDYYLPRSLKAGDKVLILSTGSYTTTYCSVAFNGFPPYKEYYI